MPVVFLVARLVHAGYLLGWLGPELRSRGSLERVEVALVGVFLNLREVYLNQSFSRTEPILLMNTTTMMKFMIIMYRLERYFMVIKNCWKI